MTGSERAQHTETMTKPANSVSAHIYHFLPSIKGIWGEFVLYRPSVVILLHLSVFSKSLCGQHDCN